MISGTCRSWRLATSWRQRQTFVQAFASTSSANNTATGKNAPGYGTPGDFVAHLKEVGFTLPNGKKLLNNIHLGFLHGAKIGVLGANGAGKSTLVKLLAGAHKDFDGEKWTKPGLKIGYLQQEPDLDPEKDVFNNIMDGLKESQDLLQKFDEVSLAMGEPDADFDDLLEKQAELQAKIEELNCWDLSHEVTRVMQALRVPDGTADVTLLSGGERRRVALCRLLLEKPDMLILDEPTNHLDAASVRWLETFLQQYKGTVISITHDRYFLDNVAGWILEIDRGSAIPFQGNYSEWLKAKSKRIDMENRREAAQAKQAKKELEWIMTHQGQNRGSKARLKSMSSASSGDEMQRVEEGQIIIPAGPRLGDKVIVAKNLSKTYDGRTLFKDVSLEITPKSVVGIVGGNGTGKSTLVNIIAGITEPDTGSVEMGSTVQLGYVSQSRSELNPKRTVYEEIAGGNEYVEVDGRQIQARAYVAAFNLRGPAQEKKVGALSGGERNRVQLAKSLLQGHNVLILDEPTNDLDVDTLRSLEGALSSFEGVTILISHDRWFLDRLCTHIIAFEDADDMSTVEMFPGNYSEYEREYKAITK